MKINLLLSSIILISILSGCSKESETLPVELPAIENESSNSVDSNKEESNFKSIRDYLKENKDLSEEFKNTDVLSSVSGYITQPKNFDVPKSLKSQWKNNKHVSVSRLSHEYYFGFDNVRFQFNEANDGYVVLKGILYNNNDEDVSLAILGDSKLYLNNIKCSYDTDYHVNNNLIDFKDPKKVLKANSSLPIEIYYKILVKKYSDDDINVFGDLSLTNLKETLYLQSIKYPEDLSDSEKSIYTENYNIYKKHVN